jgi:hypothetical protein
MAELLKDGSIRMRDGRILWGRDVVQIIDVLELSELLVPTSKSFGGGFGGGGRGVRGLPGPTGTQGLPGIISLVQDEGFNLPLQNTLNFIGDSVSVLNDPGNGRLNITVDDTRAATFVVGPDHADYPMTEAGLIAAIAALPAVGGDIYIREGTIALTATIVLPDKSVRLCGAGYGSTIISIGANAISAFTIPNGLTARRIYYIRDLAILGGSVAGQVAFTHSDAGCLDDLYTDGVAITNVECVDESTAGDITFNVIRRISHENGIFTPPDMATAGLVMTNNPAGTFSYMVLALYTNMLLGGHANFGVGGKGWGFDFDGDIYWNHVEIVIRGTAKCDGFVDRGSVVFDPFPSLAFLEFYGNASGNLQQAISDSYYAVKITIKGSTPFAIVNSELRHGLVLEPDNCYIANTKFRSVSASGVPAVDVIAGADSTTISGCQFYGTPTTAFIRTAAQKLAATGCVFAAPGGVNTILETVGANFNLGVGNIGLSTGAGLSLVGANTRFTIGDYNFA